MSVFVQVGVGKCSVAPIEGLLLRKSNGAEARRPDQGSGK